MALNRRLVVSVMGLGVGALIAWPVYAHCGRCLMDTKKMVTMMADSKLSLGQAVATAEEHTKGKAVVAHCELEDGKLEVEVYCLVGDKIQEVEIDGKTGKVTEVEEHKMLPKFDEDEYGEHEEHEDADDD